MGREIKVFTSEERKARPDVQDFLHKLADRVGEGQAVLSHGGQSVTVKMPNSVILQLQVEDEDKGSKGMQRSLKIEIKWFDQDDQSGSSSLVLE